MPGENAAVKVVTVNYKFRVERIEVKGQRII
jgi:hypothetical protein